MGLLKDFERAIKDLRGKDVPESPLRDHEELKELLLNIIEMVWEKLKDKMPREQFDLFALALKDLFDDD